MTKKIIGNLKLDILELEEKKIAVSKQVKGKKRNIVIGLIALIGGFILFLFFISDRKNGGALFYLFVSFLGLIMLLIGLFKNRKSVSDLEEINSSINKKKREIINLESE